MAIWKPFEKGAEVRIGHPYSLIRIRSDLTAERQRDILGKKLEGLIVNKSWNEGNWTVKRVLTTSLKYPYLFIEKQTEQPIKQQTKEKKEITIQEINKALNPQGMESKLDSIKQRRDQKVSVSPEQMLNMGLISNKEFKDHKGENIVYEVTEGTISDAKEIEKLFKGNMNRDNQETMMKNIPENMSKVEAMHRTLETEQKTREISRKELDKTIDKIAQNPITKATYIMESGMGFGTIYEATKTKLGGKEWGWGKSGKSKEILRDFVKSYMYYEPIKLEGAKVSDYRPEWAKKIEMPEKEKKGITRADITAGSAGLSTAFIAAGAGATGKVAQFGTEAIYAGMAGQSIGTAIKEPSKEKIIDAALISAPLVISGVGKGVLRFSKAKTKWEILKNKLLTDKKTPKEIKKAFSDSLDFSHKVKNVKTKQYYEKANKWSNELVIAKTSEMPKSKLGAFGIQQKTGEKVILINKNVKTTKAELGDTVRHEFVHYIDPLTSKGRKEAYLLSKLGFTKNSMKELERVSPMTARYIKEKYPRYAWDVEANANILAAGNEMIKRSTKTGQRLGKITDQKIKDGFRFIQKSDDYYTMQLNKPTWNKVKVKFEKLTRADWEKLKEVISKRDDTIIGGSTSQMIQLKKGRTAADIDLFIIDRKGTGLLKAAQKIFEQTYAKKTGSNIYMNKRNTKQKIIDFLKGEVNPNGAEIKVNSIKGEQRGKVEFHPETWRKAFTWSEKPITTKDGLRIISLREQLRRKIYGAFQSMREKDLKDIRLIQNEYKKLIKEQGETANEKTNIKKLLTELNKIALSEKQEKLLASELRKMNGKGAYIINNNNKMTAIPNYKIEYKTDNNGLYLPKHFAELPNIYIIKAKGNELLATYMNREQLKRTYGKYGETKKITKQKQIIDKYIKEAKNKGETYYTPYKERGINEIYVPIPIKGKPSIYKDEELPIGKKKRKAIKIKIEKAKREKRKQKKKEKKQRAATVQDPTARMFGVKSHSRGMNILKKMKYGALYG